MSTNTRTREARSEAAKMGWENRRLFPKPAPTPESIAWGRILDLFRVVDPGPARLLCCDLAASALRHYIARYPDDPRPHTMLYVARRYARGEADDRERLEAHRLGAFVVEGRWPGDIFHGDDPAYGAIEAVAFCLHKDPWTMLRWATDWAKHCSALPAHAFNLQLLAALEAMPRRRQTTIRTLACAAS